MYQLRGQGSDNITTTKQCKPQQCLYFICSISALHCAFDRIAELDKTKGWLSVFFLTLFLVSRGPYPFMKIQKQMVFLAKVFDFLGLHNLYGNQLKTKYNLSYDGKKINAETCGELHHLLQRACDWIYPELLFALIIIIISQPGHNFAQVRTAQLPWHVKKFNLIG